MTTADTHARTPEPAGCFRLPDIPEREPDDMTSAEHLSETGLHHHWTRPSPAAGTYTARAINRTGASVCTRNVADYTPG